ncbi:MAG: site-specific integrase [Solirubrobacterales bacterium]|nr:site-specific integrase [Solirubrobacterales bacterium]
MNLANGTIFVSSSKTDAGAQRVVDLPGDSLTTSSLTRPTATLRQPRTRYSRPAATTVDSRDAQRSDNVRPRLKTAIKRANKKLERAGIEKVNSRVSPHSLRRTFASIPGGPSRRSGLHSGGGRMGRSDLPAHGLR